MNKTIKFLVILLAVIVACALVAWLPGRVSEPCTGEVYASHPGLRAECLHQQAIAHGAYPAPGDGPYPAPGTIAPAPAPVIYPTVTQEPTPTSAPDNPGPTSGE